MAKPATRDEILDQIRHMPLEDRDYIEAVLLVVCHCYRDGHVIRIISARKANRRERRTYQEQTQ